MDDLTGTAVGGGGLLLALLVLARELVRTWRHDRKNKDQIAVSTLEAEHAERMQAFPLVKEMLDHERAERARERAEDKRECAEQREEDNKRCDEKLKAADEKITALQADVAELAGVTRAAVVGEPSTPRRLRADSTGAIKLAEIAERNSNDPPKSDPP